VRRYGGSRKTVTPPAGATEYGISSAAARRAVRASFLQFPASFTALNGFQSLCSRASGDAHDSPVPFGTTKPAQQLAVARSTLSMAAESSPAAPTAFTQRYLLPPALVSEVEATVKRFVELRSCGSARSADGATTPTIGREGSSYFACDWTTCGGISQERCGVIEFRSFTLDGASVLGPIEEAGPADAAIAHMPFGGSYCLHLVVAAVLC
jgi:hypothetical protein